MPKRHAVLPATVKAKHVLTVNRFEEDMEYENVSSAPRRKARGAQIRTGGPLIARTEDTGEVVEPRDDGRGPSRIRSR